MDLQEIDVSYNDGITGLHPAVFELVHGGTVRAEHMSGIPCDGDLCWYFLYEWKFTIDGDIRCDGDWTDIDQLSSTYLRCAGM